MRIAILGDKKSVLGFKALGVEAFDVAGQEDLEKAKEKISQAGLAVLLLSEELAQKYPKQIEGFYSQTLPAVLVVPGVSGQSKIGRQGLKKILERALGSDTLS